MTTIINLVQTKLTEEQIKKRVITNVVKMLYRRKILNLNEAQEYINKFIILDDDKFKITTNDDKIIIIKLMDNSFPTISKQSELVNFLNKNNKTHNIIIVKTIANKVLQYIAKNYKTSEVFHESFFMIDLPKTYIVPEHIPLSEEDGQKVMNEYLAQKRQLHYIESTDACARYYNIKIGQIVKIKRPLITSGYEPAYKLCIKKKFG